MISVDINIDPFGQTDLRETLCRIAIWNDGTGDFETGNYKWAVSHQLDSTFGQRAARKSGIEDPSHHDLVNGGPWVWKQGEVKNFRRQRGAAALLAQVTKAARL